MKSCHSNKKTNSEIVTWLMTSSPCMWHGKIFYGKCYLVVVWHSSTYKIDKVIKLLKNCLKDSAIMIMIIYFYNNNNNYYYYYYYYYYYHYYKWYWSKRVSVFVFSRCRTQQFEVLGYSGKWFHLLLLKCIDENWSLFLMYKSCLVTYKSCQRESKINYYSWYLSRGTGQLIKWIHKVICIFQAVCQFFVNI